MSDEQRPTRLEALTRLEAVLDGAEGYISEHGDDGRYWQPGVLTEGRRVVDEWRRRLSEAKVRPRVHPCKRCALRHKTCSLTSCSKYLKRMTEWGGKGR